MNTKFRPLLSITLVSAAIFSASAYASPILFSGLSPTNFFDSGSTHQWTSGDLSLPTGTTIGPAGSIELLLTLTGNVPTNSSGDFGAGIKVDPLVAPGAEIFGFSYQLLEGGVPVGSPFGFDLLNPFLFAVDNVSTGEPSGAPTGVLFDGVDVTVYNNTLTETVTDFTVYLGTPKSSVPDTFATLGLLSLGLLATVGFGYRRMNALCRI
jgi:hypothetical protein